MKIGIDFGHTKKGPNYGAVGVVHESHETRAIGKALIKYLESLGHTVVNITVDYAKSTGESINTRVKNANKHDLDMVISIHLNAFNCKAHGVEVLTFKGMYRVEADRILKNIERLGYTNRGIKNGTSPRRLGIINNVKAPSMIVECFFCDNKQDVAKYNPDDIAKAIAEGITNQKIGNAEKTGDENMKTEEEIKPLPVNKNNPSEWAKESWEWAKANCITDGSNPRQTATREEVVALIHRTLGGIK